MRRINSLVLTMMALFALGAFAATSIASAEEDPNSPSLLVLEGKGTEIKGTLTGGESKLATLGGKIITNTKTEAKLEGCEKVEGSEKDVTLCKDVPIKFEGWKQGKISCRSEMPNGEEKDPVETVLALLDLHIAAELAGTELQPLLLMKVLGPLLEATLTINCGGIKDELKGVLPCLLLPGLKMVKIVEVLCKQNASFDQETGKCEKLCELLEKEPFLSNLGAGNEDAGMTLLVKGELNKEIFLDD